MSPSCLDFLGDDNTATPAFGSRFVLKGSSGSMSSLTSSGAGPALHGPVASAPPLANYTLHGPVVSVASAQPPAPYLAGCCNGSSPAEQGAPPSGPVVPASPTLQVVACSTSGHTISTHPVAITPVDNALAMHTIGKSGF
jgi:hypothetical protein